jgi:hypothetical protein
MLLVAWVHSIILAWPLTFYIGGEFRDPKLWGEDGNVAQCILDDGRITCRAMGDGLHNGRVNALAVKDRNHVYAAGSFHSNDDKRISFVAM